MEKLQLDDFKQYHFLSKLQYSPDGTASAVVASKANGKNGYNSAIYVKNCDKGFRRLTASTGKIDTYTWLDDKTILFSEIRDPDKKKAVENGEELSCFHKICLNGGEACEAFTLDLKVSEIHRIDEKNFLINAVFNNSRPDFTGKEPHEKQQMLEDLKKQKSYQIIDELPFWFNGLGFTNKVRNRLYTYSLENGIKAVTEPLMKIADYKLSSCGKYVVYTGQHFDNVASTRNNVYIYSIETGETTLLLDDTYLTGELATWKGKIVIMLSKGDKHGNNQNRHFYLLDCKTKELSLLKEYPLSVCTPVNSDNRLGSGTLFKVLGDDLYFTSLNRFYTDLYKMNLVTAEIERLTENDGSVDFFDVSENGIQVVAMRQNRLQEVYAVSGGKYEKISCFNEEIYQNKQYQVPKYHTFTNSEGTEIDGWAILPVDYNPNKKYPAILNIHGGPKTAFGDIYFHEMQYWANQGYFVIFCNPTGSDGRGDAFADIRGKYGSIDYEDLMQFTDEMLKAYPAIDPGKVGVTGGSYGGFMTNWIIGHTDRFKAAASQRSIANWIGFTYICDIGYNFGVDQMQADAWSNVDKLWYHSPLKYADNAKTPTLFIHSDEDYRCWVPEALQMFTALKIHNVETRMCLFHGENHELSRSGKPENRIQRLTEITQWMDKFLK